MGLSLKIYMVRSMLETDLRSTRINEIRRLFKTLCKELSGKYKEEREGSSIVISCSDIPEGKWAHLYVWHNCVGGRETYGFNIHRGPYWLGGIDEFLLEGIKKIKIEARESADDEILIMPRDIGMQTKISVKHPRAFRVKITEDELNIEFL